jgi:antitoxin ParD1/3/4
MNVSLTPELESLINKKVQSGLYNSASEVVREALRLLEEKDRLREIRLDELRRDVMNGAEQIRNGNYIQLNSEEELREFGESIIRRGRERLEAKSK